MNFTILRFETLDSTNTEAARQAKSGAAEGIGIVAREQTAGRGRYGRQWASPPNAGLYFSLILRPKIESKFLPLITLATAVAVCETLKTFKLAPDIKWVNDLLIGEKKIGGILSETYETSYGLAVIVGIGINLTSKNFPAEISDIATSIEQETGRKISAEVLVEKLIENLARFLELLYSPGGELEICREWIARSSYAFDKKIRAVVGNEAIMGITCGIEENGALRVKTDSGEIKIVQAGEIEKLRSA